MNVVLAEASPEEPDGALCPTDTNAVQGLQWVYGISTDIRDNAVYLSGGDSERIAYAAGHTLVVFDSIASTQTFLQVSN